jgi:hypothetical protein
MSAANNAITWSVSGAAFVFIDNGIGAVPLVGSTGVTHSGKTTYTLTASGPGGTTVKTLTVAAVNLVFRDADAEARSAITASSGNTISIDGGPPLAFGGAEYVVLLASGSHSVAVMTADGARASGNFVVT